jgi:serine/threonine protein phosphatase PrpC
VLSGDRFCEQCGASLISAESELGAAACSACGAPLSELDADGYCSSCGTRERDPGEHIELDLVLAAAVSDRGHVHHRNEDAFSLDIGAAGDVAAVVCDGISTSTAPDAAARAAADAAAAILTGAFDGTTADLSAITGDAIAHARRAVTGVQWTTRADRALPSCTLVCTLVRGGEIAVASVGDSRAYWIDADGARRLTIDDSWAQEQIAAGAMSAQEAFKDRRAHSITNWIGADAPEADPGGEMFRPASRGLLLLCTDGLWNYLTDDSELARLISDLPDGASPAAVARELTEVALARGGHDNITVAVIDVDPISGGSDEHLHN